MKTTKRGHRQYLNSRYPQAGKESGTIHKDHGGKCRLCLAYPNTYRIGMSSLGLRLVYSMLNARDDVVCERVFLPEQAMTGRLLTLESQTMPSEFDIMAFSISYENDFQNVVKILRASGIPPYAKDRDPRYPLLIMGGPCAFMNPEPLADFFDVIVVAEAEAVLDEFIETYNNSVSRVEFLEALKGVEGMYVPATHSGGAIKRRYLRRMDMPPVGGQLITPDTEFSSMYLIEAMRGCPWHCRFCAISGIYGTPRVRALESMQEEIGRAVGLTKKIGVIGASLTDYPNINELLCIEGVEFSISSLRASKKAALITALIKNKKSVSIAPEAGSVRLRAAINKKITHEDIIETSRLVLSAGIAMLRLYFMIGLPTETDEDIDAMIDLVKEIRALSTAGRIALSVSAFVPKPFTPFQWQPMTQELVILKRLKQLKDGLKRENVGVNHDHLKYAFTEGLLAMGDRRLSSVIVSMADGLSWKNACASHSINPSEYLFRKKQYDEPLPWDFIDNGIKKDSLWREYLLSGAVQIPDDTSSCGHDTKLQSYK
ncbi:MAG: radical SAM protein [Candidatus Magnetominusculus sp. LBB02]|nr:radical SAM protein [Candidatus Magnetominusculus sp. LBB02]